MYQRQSIVNRRKIPPSKKNDEFLLAENMESCFFLTEEAACKGFGPNIDREYDVQMCYLRKRQENFKDIEQLVRTTVSPTRDEVLDSQWVLKSFLSSRSPFEDKQSRTHEPDHIKQHLKYRNRHKWKGIMDLQLEQKEEQHEIQSETDYKLHCFNDYVQRCMGPHSKEEEESREQARRDYLRELMEENMKIAAEKVEWKKLQKQKDIALDNYRLSTPSTWNRRHYV